MFKHQVPILDAGPVDVVSTATNYAAAIQFAGQLL